MTTLDLDNLVELFFEEAEEHLAAFEAGLLELEQNPGGPGIVDRIFRAAHSIKGASGTFGYNDVTSFTHRLETVLDRLRCGELAYDPQVAAVLLRSIDVLKALVHAARAGSPAPAEAAVVRAELERFVPHVAAGQTADAAAQAAPAHEAGPLVTRRVVVCFRPKIEFMARGMDPLAFVRDLADAGEVITLEIDKSKLPPLAAMEPESAYLAWRVELDTSKRDAEIRELFEFCEDSSDIVIEHAPETEEETHVVAAPVAAKAAAGAPPANHEGAASTIRVATEKVDKLLDLVGELVIAQAMIVEAARSPSQDATTRLDGALVALERHTRELQERVMSIRMVPLATVFRRLPRLVRDLASMLGKNVRLVVDGENTEIDKSMVEQLADPLTHLVRNAIDHGLEAPADRLAAGKVEEGTISIRAFHQGGAVVIELADDGRGLSTTAIRAKAERLGLVSPDAQLADEEIHAFIFHPGFSTAQAVSDVSGRGVGMDVVKRNVEAMNGSLALATESGHGTKLTLRLPLTLAIVDGLSVRVGQQVFIVPLLSVLETFRPASSQVKGIFGLPEVIDVRGTSLPIIRLHDLLNVPGAERDPSKALVCVVESNGTRVALLVDEVLGQLQVVVKSLETNFRKVDALTGATILGDGTVAMIVDVQALARSVASRSHAELAAAPLIAEAS